MQGQCLATEHKWKHKNEQSKSHALQETGKVNGTASHPPSPALNSRHCESDRIRKVMGHIKPVKTPYPFLCPLFH